jgi:uncharacterized spore protein YtfJ
MDFDAMANTLLEKMKAIAQTETVIGKPIQIDSTTLIPVSRVSIGFGMGGVSGKSQTGGSGGGLTVEPIAFIVIQGESARILSLTRDKDLLGKAMELVPEVVSLFKKEK